MKKKSLILVFLISLFIFVGSVKAESSFNCAATVTAGNDLTCTVTIDGNPLTITSNNILKIKNISGAGNVANGDYSATFTSSSNLVFETTDEDIGKAITISSDTGTTKNVAVNEKVTTTTTTTTKKVTTTTKSKSSDCYLSSITIDGERIDGFNKTVTKYKTTVEYDIESITVDAKTSDSNATIDMDGPALLKVGENEYTITVTAEDETTKVYKIVVTRSEKSSSTDYGTKLKSIKIKNYKFSFDKDSRTFYLTINKNTDKLNITATPYDKDAEVKITDNEDLTDGSIIKIQVSKEDEKTTTYRIIIEKDESEKKSVVPFIIIGIISLVIIGLVAFMIIKKKHNKTNNTNIKDNNDESKTKEIKKVYNNTDEEDIHIDNDEEEKTRILNFEGILDDSVDEETDEEKTKVIDLDHFSSEIDEAFKNYNGDDYDE